MTAVGILDDTMFLYISIVYSYPQRTTCHCEHTLPGTQLCVMDVLKDYHVKECSIPPERKNPKRRERMFLRCVPTTKDEFANRAAMRTLMYLEIMTPERDCDSCAVDEADDDDEAVLAAGNAAVAHVTSMCCALVGKVRRGHWRLPRNRVPFPSPR